MQWNEKAKGKVRTVYESPDGALIKLRAGDGVSAFDEELGVIIPNKGTILTQMSEFWFRKTGHIVPNAFIPGRVDSNEMIMCKLMMFPVEFIVRGYITGSMWKAYKAGERFFCGIELPDGLQECSKLPYPLFTPTTKAPKGQHDQNITFEELVKIISDAGMGDRKTANNLMEYSINLYKYCAGYALGHQIILADTKFEFGLDANGNIRLADEVCTPDSSRFWDATTYEVGHDQASMDKQIIRNWVSAQKALGNEHPRVPADILLKTKRQYELCAERLGIIIET